MTKIINLSDHRAEPPILTHRWPRHIPSRFEKCCEAYKTAGRLQGQLRQLLDESECNLQKELLISAINAVCDAQISISQVRKKS